MTQDKNQGSENLNWMEIADTDAINEPRHTGQRLPFIAAAVSLLIIGGGAVFAQTSNESPAQAEETSVTQTSQTSSTVSDPAISSPSATTPSGIPVIPNVAPGVGGYDEDDEDDEDEYEDDDDHEDEDEDEYEDEDDD